MLSTPPAQQWRLKPMTSSQHYLQIYALKYEIQNSNGKMPDNVRAWMEQKIDMYEQPELPLGVLAELSVQSSNIE